MLLSTPLVVNILSSCVAVGGYRASDFKDYASNGGSEAVDNEKASLSFREVIHRPPPTSFQYPTQLDALTWLQDLKYLTPLLCFT